MRIRQTDTLYFTRDGNVAMTKRLNIGSMAVPTSTLQVNGTFATTVLAGQVAGINNPGEQATIYIYSGGTGAITLPTGTAFIDRRYVIVNNTGSTRTIPSYINLGGAASTTINNATTTEFVYDGTNWYRIQ